MSIFLENEFLGILMSLRGALVATTLASALRARCSAGEQSPLYKLSLLNGDCFLSGCFAIAFGSQRHERLPVLPFCIRALRSDSLRDQNWDCCKQNNQHGGYIGHGAITRPKHLAVHPDR